MPDATATAPVGDPAKPWLVLDTSTAWTQVGRWDAAAGQWSAFHREATPALESLARLVRAAFAPEKLEPGGCGAIVLNTGPGSSLGLRIALMMVNGWRALPGWEQVPVGTFSGLLLQARHPAAAGEYHLPFRQEIDNVASAGLEPTLALRSRAELPPESVRRTLIPLRPNDRAPEGWTRREHDLAALTRAWPEWAEAITWTARPEVYVPKKAQFKPWQAVPHRARQA